jgi:hypothetical protein
MALFRCAETQREHRVDDHLGLRVESEQIWALTTNF